MLARLMKKTKISKFLVIAITIQFIFSGIPASAYESFDNLRPQAGAQRDGGDVNVLGSEIVNYVNSKYGSFVRFYAENFKVAGKNAKEQEKNVGQVLLLPQLKKLYEDGKLAGSLLAHSANRKAGIDELAKEIELGLTAPVTNIEAARKESEAAANGLISKLGLSLEDDARQVFYEGIFQARTAPRFTKTEAKAEARERAVARYNEIINHRVQALLDTNIEVINVCVGSEKKDITLEQQIFEIQQQLEKYFEGVTQEKLKGKIVKVYFEPTALIGKIAEAGAGQDAAAEEDMIRDVHQAMFNWLEKKFGFELAKSMYGKSFLTDYGASVDGKNVKRVMAVKSVREDMKDTPLVHGVLFATYGKDVFGYLEVADGVQEAAIRDNARYDCVVNLKNFNVTVPVEYLREIYAAVYSGRINPARVDLAIADNDKNLEGWINALALAEKDRQAVDQVAMEKLLFDLGTFKDTETFSQLRRAINRLSPEQIERLRIIANADKYSKYDMERRLSLVLKPTNIFISAGNAVIFSEGGFKSWLDMWEPGQNIVAIKSLEGAKQLNAREFVRQNFFSGGVFARYQIPGLRLGGVISRQEVEQAGLNWGDVVQKLTKKENNWAGQVNDIWLNLNMNLDKTKNAMSKEFGSDFSKILPILERASNELVIVDGKKIDTIIVPGDKNVNRPEMRILYFGPEWKSNKKAIEITRKLGIGPDVVAEYGPGKDEGGKQGGTNTAKRIREFVEMGLPVACASPVHKDGIKSALKSLGMNPKIAFKEALYAHNRDKVTSNVWVVDTLSCTSNAMISAIVAIHEAFGIVSGSGETVHAMTASNAVFPQPSGRARDPIDVLRGISIIEDIQDASTGAAKNLFKIIPELETKFPITAKRVGVITGSAFTIHMRLKEKVTQEQVKEALRNFANNKSNGMVKFYEGIAGVVDVPLDTNAIVGWSEVSIIDGFLIQVLGTEDEIIIKGLYDNESAAPGQLAHRWAPHMVDARRAKELLVPSPVYSGTAANLANPPYMSTMGRKDFENKKVLARLDLNVPGVEGKQKKITAAIKTIAAPLDNGAETVVVVSHRGRPDGKVDMDSSLGPVAEKLQEMLKDKYKVVFHEGSITNKGLAKGLKQKIVKGAINILEDTRFYEGEEGNDWVFAAGLADLVDNEMFIFDAFGAGERTGGSLDLVANYVEKIALGYIMENETTNLQEAKEKLFSIYLGGGPKASEKIPIVKKAIPNIKEGGFIGIGSGPAPAFLKALYGIEIGTKFSTEDLNAAQEIIALTNQYNKKLVLPSDFVMVDRDLTKKADNSDKSWLELKNIPEGANIYHVTIGQLIQGMKEGTFIDQPSGKRLSPQDLFAYDIGAQSVKEVGDLVRGTPKDLWNVWNGAPGVNEIKQFENGARGLGEAYSVVSQRQGGQAKAGTLGSDTAAMAEQIGIDEKIDLVSTGGSSGLTIMQDKELLVMNGLRKAQADINTAQKLGESAAEYRAYLQAVQTVNKAIGGESLTGLLDDLAAQKVDLKGKLLIVGPEEYKLGGEIAIRELIKLAPAIGLYGPDAAKLRDLVGTKNIKIAGSLEELLDDALKMVRPADILLLRAPQDKVDEAKLKELNIRVIVSSGVANLDIARAVKGLSGGSLTVKEAFANFLDMMVNAKVLELSNNARERLLAELEEGQPPLAFAKGDVKVTDRIAKDLGVKKAQEFISEFI